MLLFLTGPLQYLPRCVLASIVFTIAFGMIDVTSYAIFAAKARGNFISPWSPLRRLLRSASNKASCWQLSFSIFRHVRHSYNPHAMLFAPDVTGRWVPSTRNPQARRPTRTSLFIAQVQICSSRNTKRFADQVRTLRGVRADARPLVRCRCGGHNGY